MRIFIVDHHEVVREGLRAAMAAEADDVVVGEAASAREALALLRRVLPDVVITEFHLPDMSGDEFCSTLMERYPGVAVVIQSSHLSEDRVNRAVRAGAVGFVTKAAGLDELRSVLSAVRRGETRSLSGQASAIVQRLFERSAQHHAPRSLTPRQERVLELAAQGLTYTEISEVLHVSESTVRFHIQSLKARLGVRTRVELVAVAIQDALIVPEQSPVAA